MKNKLFILLTLIVSFICINKIDALAGYTTDYFIIVRSEPGTYGSVLGQIDGAYTTLDLVSSELYNKGDSNCNPGWYKVNYNGTTGYMCGLYVSVGNITSTDPGYNTGSYEARVNGLSIYARSEASTSSSLVATLAPGTELAIHGDKIYNSGCIEGWYNVTFHKNKNGYVCSKYVVRKSEITASDASYEQELRNKGFTDGYLPYLVYLHQKHPNWVFNAVNTGYNWDEALSSETPNKNFINYAYLYDDEIKPLYSNGETRESGWYFTTTPVIAYYLDPRNFLTEKFIFMFEKQNYDYGTDGKSSLNKNGASYKKYYSDLKSILSGTYLDTDYYINVFIEAGFENDVSPSLLASRVVQEGTARESNPIISGTYETIYNGHSLKGLYNYYNINAVVSGGYDTTANGLAYACGSECGFSNSYGRPWKTREAAIKGGADFIATGYIKEGQYTLYFQHFNTSPTSSYGLASHQYQTNVLAPCDEGSNVYYAYLENGKMESRIEFDIPVYNNMPESVNLPIIASTTNTLNNIKIDGVSIENFNKNLLEYTYYVGKDTKEVKIEVSKDDSLSRVTGDGKVTLNGDSTVVRIIVTAESGATRIYQITIKKASDSKTLDQIVGSLSTKQSNGIMYNINPGTVVSTLVNSIKRASSTVTVTVTNSNGSSTSSTDLLKTGQKIKMTTSGGETRTYTISVTGDPSGDGKVTILDLLQVQKHLLGSTTLNNERLKSIDTNHDEKTSILDLLRVQKYILGDITSF